SSYPLLTHSHSPSASLHDALPISIWSKRGYWFIALENLVFIKISLRILYRTYRNKAPHILTAIKTKKILSCCVEERISAFHSYCSRLYRASVSTFLQNDACWASQGLSLRLL